MFHQIHMLPRVAYLLCQLAETALQLDNPSRAARLLGIYDNIARTAGAWNHVQADPIKTTLRERLGEDRFNALFEEGQGMPYAEGITFALSG